MKKFFIGVDVSKDTVDVMIVIRSGRTANILKVRKKSVRRFLRLVTVKNGDLWRAGHDELTQHDVLDRFGGNLKLELSGGQSETRVGALDA